ncbi:MAG: RecQ family ATP-dependent DNA helicase [Flavobacteriales bacterium]|nr:RecQ family ATP-dependent DNA helicase [Flavobacteriales bacterium]
MKRTPESVLKEHWGYDAFRPMQRDIVQQPLDGNDALALLPTGGGKSICFQVPALCMDGLCIVISPLIALMKDQVMNLNQRGIPALALHSGLKYYEIDAALDRCVNGEFKFLYLSPERLRAEIFQVRVKMMKVCLIAVDEAHCISQWGYDFRPPYLQIADLRQLLPKVPVLALTATATPEVVKDIQKWLAFKRENVIQASFRRENLTYMVLREDEFRGRLLRIYSKMPGSSVIYVRSRRRTEEVAQFLASEGVPATFYHAGLAADDRDRRQEEWLSGKVRVMVATNAFGMGIDKPDVRTVIHLGFPDSLEAYFQEAGRGGRDGENSYAVALIASKDISDMRLRLDSVFPSREFISGVYAALGNWFHLANGSGVDEWFDFHLGNFCKRYDWQTQDVLQSISFLEKADHLILSTHSDPRSTLQFTIHHDQLYDLELRNPRTARVTKVLLRSYSGMFDGQVPISEQTVAKRAGFELKETVIILEKLHAAKVIDYRPSRGLPKLNFVNGKLPKGHLYISTEMYEQRKASILATLKAALHYMESQLICRSRLLLGYFGEMDTEPCGKCDVCIARKSAPLSKEQILEVKHQLAPLLATEQSMESLAGQLPHVREQHLVFTIQSMLDDGDVACLSNGHLRAIGK